MSDKRNYFNNTKIANSIGSFSDLSGTFAISELGKNKPNVNSYIDFTTEDLKELNSNVRLTRFDLVVMDAAYTIMKHGNSTFTPEMIANTIAGKSVKFDKNTSKKLDEITKTIEKLASIRIRIDGTAVMRAKRKINDKDLFVITSNLLPVNGYYYLSKIKGESKVAFKFLSKPVLYEYAEALGRVISVPSSLLTIEGVREDNDFYVIKQELIKEIEIIKNKRNNYETKLISYEWKDDSETRGFFHRIGLNKNDFKTDDLWRQKKSRVNEQIKIILNHLVETKYISGFSFEKNGKAITGINIEI